MNLVWTRNRILLAAVLVMAVAVGRAGFSIGLDAVADARLPNPDSFYKLVLLEDHDPQTGFHFVARDNAPQGNWVHWSLPHSWTVWQAHRPLVAAGLPQRPALLWAGVGVTMLSMLLLSALVALAVALHASHRAALVSALTLATSLPLLGYGRLDQITHHIFMLVPVAAAAACFLRPLPPARLAWPDALGGGLLGLALWISPETMPLVAGLAAVRAVLKLESPAPAPTPTPTPTPSLTPVAVGLLAVVALGGWVDPPPPGYGAWALDHISLAWLVFAALLAVLLLLADALAARGVARHRATGILAAAAAAAAAGWLLGVPGALHGPSGLIPHEMKVVWWDHIKELQSAQTPHQWVAYLMMPWAAAALGGWAAWRTRRGSLALLALMALVYGLLGAWHLRMGAAGAVVAALTLGLGLTQFRIFVNGVVDASLTLRQQMAGLVLILLPVLQMLLVLGLLLWQGTEAPAKHEGCALPAIAPALNRLPPATVLVPVFDAPELLYRTHHRSVAGPYHHNVQGILDVYRAWSDPDAEGARARAIVARRGVDYLLGCTRIQRELRGTGAAPSLATRVRDGDVPGWLVPVPWDDDPVTDWRLYRVVAAGQPR